MSSGECRTRNTYYREMIRLGYKLISVKCPDCGQTLSIEENRTQAFCSYCGAKVLISNENEYVFRQVDEADIRKAETERLVRLRELDIAEKNSSLHKVLMVIWLIITLILLTIAIVLMLSPGSESMPGWAGGFLFLFYACAPIIGGEGYLVFQWLPEKENEKVISSQGGIRFPGELAPFSDRKYSLVEDTLRSVGFTNITCVNLHDLNALTALVSRDKIEKVTINGKTIASGGKIYMPDVPIVITYHGR